MRLAQIAEPTFDREVDIPVAGKPSVPVKFKFKHRTRTELKEFIAARPGKSDGETMREMVIGWDFEDPFTPENVELLLEKSPGVGLATFHTYIDEIAKAKAKN